MNRNSLIDYLSCILIKLIGPVIRKLPLNFSFWLGLTFGDLFYYFDLKHKAAAYSNIKAALLNKAFPSQLSAITKGFYRNFGQNLIDILLIPLIDKKYIKKYITIEGIDYVNKAFKKGKGVIFLGMHIGSWELSNIICANMGFPFVLFVRDLKYRRLNKLLNSYRIQRGCKIIERENHNGKNGFLRLRDLINTLKENQAIGMSLDQGGKGGVLVEFFGKQASMPQGAVRLALKHNAVILPVFFNRIKGPYYKVTVNPEFEIKKGGSFEKDIRDNLRETVKLFERHILAYPQEYLWTYKIWKYAKERKILILSDRKPGHLRQSESAAGIITDYLKEKGVKVSVCVIEAIFKNKFSKFSQTLSACFAGKYRCQGCMWCLRKFLKSDSYVSLIRIKPDIIISCGASLASVNYCLSVENLAKSIALMKPSILSMDKFDLVIIPNHDNPPKRENVVVTEGALNLIDETYLKEQTNNLSQTLNSQLQTPNFYIGLLIGGDTKDFRLSKELLGVIIKQIKTFAEKQDAVILATTSRRTPVEAEDLVTQELESYPRCRLLVIVNKKNLPFAIGGILGLSKIIIVSPESISMVSEAASSGHYVIVFKSNMDKRHNDFLNYLADKKYIYLVWPHDLTATLNKIFSEWPKINTLADKIIVREALARIM